MAILALHTLSLFGDWNEEYCESSLLLMQHHPAFSHPNYHQEMEQFFDFSKVFLNDDELKNVFLPPKLGEKKNIFLKDHILKKRACNNIREAFVWELAFILSSADLFIPSFPIDIEGIKVIVQPKRDIFHADLLSLPPREFIAKVTVVDYWRAHLLTYLLGFGDLSGKNIGLNPYSKMIFFDNEDSFAYEKDYFNNGHSLYVGFVSIAFDWPQYRKSLSELEFKQIQAFIASLSDVEAFLESYSMFRPLPFNKDLFIQRLVKIREFPLRAGLSFKDFYSCLYPQISGGLDVLNCLMSSILGRKVDHGISLFFLTRMFERHQMSSRNRQVLEAWIKKYM